ncbi:hypothetical protein HAX54_048721 [Datura stramonium]|uniref:Putative plant transposon protein domain-containing protein n=1 Tax=Datura stramonium TaxID=4076 RepID=A0ABS8SU31_DATST|nr:hypothetical protein [Datura stramonium]
MTSRRTFRPCTGKQSDPTYKGKWKDKKPTEEETEFGFHSELEEDLRKAKEDEEKKVELSYERRRCSPFSLNSIEEDFPDILRQIKERYREIFTIPPGLYCPTLVREFYASYRATEKHQKANGPPRLIPCLEKVKVRGVEVDCSAKEINQAYFDDDDADATDYLAKLEIPENHYTWIASLIVAGTPSWVSYGSQIYKSYLNIQAKQWLVRLLQTYTFK